jgi:hypothetical protein
MHPDHGDDDRRITYFAATHTRGKREMFGIRADDRGKHVYVIGKTGMGKSTMLENMAIQDIQNGEGIAFIDPHGATAEKLLDFIPHDRIKDVVYFAPFDTDYPVGFNVMEDVGFDKRHLVVSGLMGALKRIWVDAWSARMEYILQNTLLALLEYPDSTLLDVNKMLTNKTFRAAVVDKITDPIVKGFWTEEFAAFTDTYTREATPAIQNKVGQFTANPLIRNIVGQAKSSFDLRKMMDEKKIFIVNLSKGRMGETNAALLGSMLVVKIYLAAMSRADEPAARMAKLPRFYFYVDEFQSMMNEAFADILSESRKYKLALTLANQYIEQMEEEVRDAVFGNVGTLIVFRVGPFDAEVLETVFEPTFTPEDLVGLGIGQIYLTLMIDGVGSQPFSAETIPPIDPPPISYRDDCVSNSRAQYSRPRSEMEAMINKRQQDFAPPQSQKKDRPGERRESGGSRPPVRTGAPQRPFRTDAPRSPSPGGPPNLVRTSVQGAEQRSALRAAIEAAAPVNVRVNVVQMTKVQNEVRPASALRSPADVLREKRAMKSAASPAPASASANATERAQQNSGPLRQSSNEASDTNRQNPQPAAATAPHASRVGDNIPHEHRSVSPQTPEVSPETLRKVLRQEDIPRER